MIIKQKYIFELFNLETNLVQLLIINENKLSIILYLIIYLFLTTHNNKKC